MATLPFYIIITPSSLKYIKFALWSLQKRNDVFLTLVANGLNKQEENALIKFASQIDAKYIRLRSNTMVSHGLALNELLTQHQGRWFCFCDSDIVSTDVIVSDIPINNKVKAISSCDAMFWDDEPVKGVLGRCNQWPDGSTNLSSFFCIYETATLKNILNKYQIGFENIAANKIKSQAIKLMLQRKGFNEFNRKLDTGKAITAALDIEDELYKHVKIPSLLHIGGLSSWMLNGNIELIHSNYHLSDRDLNNLAQKDSWLYNPNSEHDKLNKIFYLRRQQRLAAARFCFQLISHYVDNTPMPKHSLSNSDFNLKIDLITNTINKFISDFS